LRVIENGVAHGGASLTVIKMKLDLQTMSREQKLKAMHEIWEDLAGDDQSLESPGWHAQLLKETADRVRDGREVVHDWEEAKEELRRRMK
jgi:hypothetical protein